MLSQTSSCTYILARIYKRSAQVYLHIFFIHKYIQNTVFTFIEQHTVAIVVVIVVVAKVNSSKG